MEAAVDVDTAALRSLGSAMAAVAGRVRAMDPPRSEDNPMVKAPDSRPVAR